MAKANSENRQNRSSSNGPVSIFWDIENCSIPKGVYPEDIASNIIMTLDAHPMFNRAVMSLAAYGDFRSLPTYQREGLQKTGITLFDVPNDGKDAADKAILVDMMLFVQNNPPPSSIMLISGDVDFASTLHILGQRGHIIILVIPSGHVAPALLNAGSFVWDWSRIAHGCLRGADMTEANSAFQPPLCQTSAGRVAILWDIKNCSVPNDVCPEVVARNIRMALRVHPSINGAVMLFSAYGNFSNFSRRLREGFQKTGVKLIDVPNGKKNAVDKAILVDMFLFVQDNPAPSSVMLISGNADFASALHKLRQRRHTIILVFPFDANVSPALYKIGRFVWDWLKVARGQDLSTEVIIGTGGGQCENSRGCSINENQDSTNEQSSTTVAMPCLASTLRSTSLSTGLNEVTAGGLISSADQNPPSGQHADVNQLKGQLVRLLEHFGGHLALNAVTGKYQSFYGSPLSLSEYGLCRLGDLFKEIDDVMIVVRKGSMQFVCLPNWQPVPSTPALGWVQKNKKGKSHKEP